MTTTRVEEAFLAGKSPLWHPFTPEPHLGPRTLWRKAEGAFVTDVDDRRYYDATSSWWCITHGHSHPRLVAALAKQAATFDQVMIAPHGHAPALELAEALLAKCGPEFGKVFLSDDGSTAVEAALKIALQYWRNIGEPKRAKFLSMELAYHGDTMGAVSVSHVSEFHGAFEGLRTPTFRAKAPYCYRCPVGRTYPGCHVACLDSALDAIDRYGDEIAAVIIEPLLLGAGGMIVTPKEATDKLVAACRERGILVIFDEVFTGFGRTGTFFAMDQLEEKPDLICLSKGLTAGMLALGATVVREEIYEAFTGGPGRAFYHGHTFTGNPLACAVALESLKLFEEERTMERVGRLAATLDAASPRFRELPRVGDVRRSGVVWAVELVVDKSTRERPSPANGPGWAIAKALWDEGIWIRPLHNMLYVVPPYATAEPELQHLLQVLYSALSKETGF